ncbi:hypothetical protein [Nocardiopsis sp. CNT312]|nr:hypothetical protein [Nocardiopsis sp. CNT312]
MTLSKSQAGLPPDVLDTEDGRLAQLIICAEIIQAVCAMPCMPS